VKRHALAKALSAAPSVKDGIVIGADTVVWQGGGIIGKPRDMRDAKKILLRLQGRWHTVYTGVALVTVKAGRARSKRVFYARSGVLLKRLTPAQIRAYFRKVNPLDKAGAYAIQAKAHSIVERTRGSFSNAVGLPMEALEKRLLPLRRRL
jgi:septum formation protein